MPNPPIAQYSLSPFDPIRKFNNDGSEFWSARDLMPILGYANWERIPEVVDRAKAACANAGFLIQENFLEPPRKSTGGRPLQDFCFTRYACYLVAMNGDPRKPEIAAAQTYFALKTREAETVNPLADLSIRNLELQLAIARETVESKRIDLEALKIEKGIIVPHEVKRSKTSAPPQPESIDLQELIATDSVAAWLNDCIRLDPDSKVYIGAATANPDALLYPNYGRYCKQHRLKLVNIQRFSKHLMSLVEATLGVKLGKQKDQKGNHVKGVAIGGSGNLLFCVLESIAINPYSPKAMILSH